MQDNITGASELINRDYFRYNYGLSSDGVYLNNIVNVTLKMNGVPIISERSNYFTDVLPAISASVVSRFDERGRLTYIHIYSWALYPNQSSISGALNISTDRQLELELDVTSTDYQYNVCAITVKNLSLSPNGNVEIGHIRYTQPK